MLFFLRVVAWLASAVLLTFLVSCEGDVSGGEQEIFIDDVPVSGVTFRLNSAIGSDASDGIEQPFASLQYALSQLRAGDKLIIAGDTSYSSTDSIGEDYDGRELQGFVIRNSGSPAAPIIIEGEFTEGLTARPIIDQQQTQSNPTDPAVLGLYLDCVSHIVVRNLEIRNANEAGITSAIDGRCETSDITIEGNYIHSIHGEKYVAGIRLMGTSNTAIRDNQIENVVSNTSVEDREIVANGRGIQNILIENNRFSSLSAGVVVNAQGLGNPAVVSNQEEPVTGLQIAHNRFFNGVDQAIRVQSHVLSNTVIGKLQTGHFTDIDIYGNIFSQVSSALIADLGDDEYQSESFCLFNNTVVDSGSTLPAVEAAIVDITGVSDLEVYNNIVVMPRSEWLVTRSPLNAMRSNSLKYSDHNLFRNADTLNWHLDIGGANDTDYIDLVSWQNAMPHPELSSLSTNPDSAVLPADPVFIDQMAGDYGLSPTSPALLAGRFGMSIGADYRLPASAALIDNDCIERVR